MIRYLNVQVCLKSLELRYNDIVEMYKNIIKPILFLLTPDFTHKLIVFCGRMVQMLPPVRWVVRKLCNFHDKSLQQEVDGITFCNPIGLSAGFDKNVQVPTSRSSWRRFAPLREANAI